MFKIPKNSTIQNDISICEPKSARKPHMSTWNPTAKIRKNAMAFLYNDQVQKLVPTISALDRHFSDNMSADIIFFHTDYPITQHMQAIANVTKRQVIFYNVDDAFTSFPKGFDPYLEEPNWKKRGKWNYQHMCRFWFKLVLDIPLVLEYQYLMRLDDDSKILGAWNNIFDLMTKREAVYFGNIEEADSEKGLPGLMKLKTFTIEYKEKYRLIPKNPNRLVRAFDIENHIRLYNTNFDVIKIEFFRKPHIRHWTDAIDATYGIFKYRWGDHVLRYLTTALFATSTEELLRTDFNLAYCHPC
ncbi:unnamed protein product [Rotaria socialis]|uniref:Uncharacterized protein n=1 Tax=Rotaria socialis TaxID=392032 RepID=A0A820SYV9_9BILA|nr:unnamed protein product [Rotaria socialis]CAF4457409.1 unnamed protein product [Rotaria socialis]